MQMALHDPVMPKVIRLPAERETDGGREPDPPAPLVRPTPPELAGWGLEGAIYRSRLSTNGRIPPCR